MSFYDDIMESLNEIADYQNGKSTARSVKVTIAPIPEITAAQVKNLRHDLNMTQGTFAAVLGVSNKTVEAWEKGTNTPAGAARRMIWLLAADNSIPQKYGIIK